MADKTTHLGLNLPLGTEFADNEALNENSSILDDEVFKRGKAINGIGVNEDGDFIINEIPFARQIVSDTEQKSSGEYLFRATGGDASLADGDATLVSIIGRRRHDGVVDEVLNMEVNNAPRSEVQETITATLDRDTFISYVGNPASITLTLTYTDAWSINPSLAGVMVEGTPIYGDSIVIEYVRADRGTIVQSSPTAFRSTGWNLYNHTNGYARVKKYSDIYGFIISGTYTSIQFSETIDGVKSSISVSSGRFTIPSDGYVWVTGGDATTTYILMTWSDWQTGYEGDWKAYEETGINLAGVMAYFPYGLCQAGSVSDEIELSTQRAIRRIERVAYSAATVEQYEEDGKQFEYDTNYIYYVLDDPVVNAIELDKTYTANDHGTEIVDSSTNVAPIIWTLYGENLVEKLKHDLPNQIDSLKGSVDNVQNGMAIVANGNVHAAIASGQFVYVKNHSTLAEGLYSATASIALNGELSTSNLVAEPSGGLNALNNKIATQQSLWAAVGITGVATLDLFKSKLFEAVQAFDTTYGYQRFVSFAAGFTSNGFISGATYRGQVSIISKGTNYLYFVAIFLGVGTSDVKPIYVMYNNGSWTIKVMTLES